ncbi:hypothetical protein evm_003336 [Chilo suppressalis]|nr:hypothetical protein evm_003336 [Chilo suppressalis]
MSKDIRSFFKPKNSQKAKVEEDDDDIIPESPDVQIRNKKKESRKKRVLCDSDEEEIFDSKKKKSSKDSVKSGTKNKSPHNNLKEVKAADLFGSGPIKRTEPLVKKEKKKTETGIHSDDDFEKSLLELDAVEELACNSIEKQPPVNVKSPNSKEKDVLTKKDTPSKKSKVSPKLKEDSKSKTDDFSSKSHANKSKVNENKRKFAEFIEEKIDSNLVKANEENTSKKKKLDDNIKDKNNGIINNVKKEADLDDSNSIDNSLNESIHENKQKKRSNKSLNESTLTDEERHERKSYSAALYQKYLNRSGPKHLGAKEIPKGSPDCLKDCAFLLTGVLDSFEREEITEAIVRYGGCIKNGISKKVTHVLAGEDAGPAKMSKAQELGIKIINENEFLQIIRDSVNKKTNDTENITKEVKIEKTPSKKDKSKGHNTDKADNKIFKGKNISGIKVEKSSSDILNEKSDKVKQTKLNHEHNNIKSKSPHKIKYETKPKSDNIEDAKSKEDIKTNNINNGAKSESCESIEPATSTLMWVDKYKPQTLKQIIGQHGDASNVKKLCNWLTKWYINRKAKLPKPSPWAKNDDGGYYKAALLSGPPGVGKTTTVSLVCKELGFDMVEFNASDTRSKTLIKEQISELLTTTSLSGFAKGVTGKQAVTKKHVLVMDEVDGMAGNEDRGGLQELIGLIKATSVPIICMCNDRNSQKMRSLVNYCYDLRFSKPRVDQIKSAMMSICFKEGVKVPPELLNQLIVAANQDIRQTMHLLAVWAAHPSQTSSGAQKQHTVKDVRLGPWEVVRKVFSEEEHKSMSLNDRSDLFFYDYSLAPLFVQENYLQVTPHCPKKEILDRVSRAADCISLGDLVDARIRTNQSWGLLPTQAMYSSVMVGQEMRGHVAGQIQFPG